MHDGIRPSSPPVPVLCSPTYLQVCRQVLGDVRLKLFICHSQRYLRQGERRSVGGVLVQDTAIGSIDPHTPHLHRRQVHVPVGQPPPIQALGRYRTSPGSIDPHTPHLHRRQVRVPVGQPPPIQALGEQHPPGPDVTLAVVHIVPTLRGWWAQNRLVRSRSIAGGGSRTKQAGYIFPILVCCPSAPHLPPLVPHPHLPHHLWCHVQVSTRLAGQGGARLIGQQPPCQAKVTHTRRTARIDKHVGGLQI